VIILLIGLSSFPQSFATTEVEFSNLRIVDFFGNEILKIYPDQSVQFTADILNNQQASQDFAFVLTTDGLEHVSWITGNLSPGQVLSPALSYAFKSEGIYTIDIYLTLLPSEVLDEENPTDFSGFSDGINQLAPSLSTILTVGETKPQIKPILSFVNSSIDPQYYIDRYHMESAYKEWFDKNYLDYTIYEAVGLPNPKVPEWIKNNAKWWSENQIQDSDFTNGIEFMIKEDIIVIEDLPEDTQKMELKDEKRAMELEREKTVPDWIRNNAGWWADGLISEDDFVSGIKYLVEHGIIRV